MYLALEIDEQKRIGFVKRKKTEIPEEKDEEGNTLKEKQTVWEPIPSNCICLSEEEHASIVEEISKGKQIKILNGKVVAEDILLVRNLDNEKERKINTLNSLFEQHTITLKQYPSLEKDSFSKQEQEARSYMLDNSIPTPWLSAISEAEGITLEQKVLEVISKADAFLFVATAIGRRHALKNLIMASTSLEELDAIELSF